MSSRRRLLLLVAPAALLLAACGGGAAQPTSARGWLRQAAKATAAARSVRLSGYVAANGNRLDFDVVSFSSGALDGTVAVGPATSHVVELRDGAAYVKASSGFWHDVGSGLHLPPKATSVLAGRWVTFPAVFANQLTSGLTLKSFSAALKSDVKAKVVGHRQVGGRKTVAVEGPRQLVVYIATAAPHYPLLAAPRPGGRTTGRIRLSGFGAGSQPRAPKGALSLRQLLSGAGL